jgi:hypothetical protein
MNPFEKLNGKKGLIAIALMMAVVMALPFAAQYYTWKVGYTIWPLTGNVASSIVIPPTSGATKATDVLIDSNVPNINLTKTAKVHFMVTSANTSALAEDYWNLKVSIKVYKDNTISWANLTLVLNGQGRGTVDRATDALNPGLYDVAIYVTYWTRAVEDKVSGSFVLNIYAEETVVA